MVPPLSTRIKFYRSFNEFSMRFIGMPYEFYLNFGRILGKIWEGSAALQSIFRKI